MSKIRVFFIFILACTLLLCGCAGQDQTPPLLLPDGTQAQINENCLDLSALDPSFYSETAEFLYSLPDISRVILPKSLSAEEMALFCSSRQGIVYDGIFTIAGKELYLSDTDIDVIGMSPAEADCLIQILPAMPNIKNVNLGNDSAAYPLSWEKIAALQSACPTAEFSYDFTFYGKKFSLNDKLMDLNHIPMTDGGAAVCEVIACMPKLEYLDMDFCGVSNEDMAAIRDAFPNVKVVWRIWFGENYSVRTDVEKILASQPWHGGELTTENIQPIIYCADLKYLDIGHNPSLESVDFLRYLPNLEVAILAMCDIDDISSLSNCPKLEFLEIQTTSVADLSPLAELKNLRHLNIGYLHNLKDISPLYGLTELERLWIGCVTPIPDEQVKIMQEKAPDCIINTTAYDPHNEWRYGHPRYELLVQQFGYDTLDYSFYWLDPKY